MGNDVAPVGGAERIGAGASLCTLSAGCEAGADAVVVVATVFIPVLEFTTARNLRADGSSLRTLPAVISEAETSLFP